MLSNISYGCRYLTLAIMLFLPGPRPFNLKSLTLGEDSIAQSENA